MTYPRLLPAVALLALFSIAACDRSEPVPEPGSEAGPGAPVSYESGRVIIETAADTLLLGVEVAETEEQRSWGLMERTSLAADSGMIFLFAQPQPATGVFWMYQTHIPLSIAFIGADGRIGSIVEMEPCTSQFPQWCPNYEAGVPFESALEVSSGYFADNGIGVGDRVVLER